MPNPLKLKLALPMLAAKARPGLARTALRGKNFPSAAPLTSERVRVAAVQMAAQWLTSAQQYAEAMHAHVLAAVQAGAQLVVFPAHTGLPLLGLLPDLDAHLDSGGDDSVGEVLRAVSGAAHSVYLETFSALAAGFKVHIVAGSIAVSEGGRALTPLLHIFDAGGALLGTQAQLSLSAAERAQGMSAGQLVRVFDLPCGKLAANLNGDQLSFEPSRVASLRGAEILVNVNAWPAPYHRHERWRGLWARVQENHVYGVAAALVGEAGPLRFAGCSAIFAPLELSEDIDGVLAEAKNAEQVEVVVSDLDLTALRERRAAQPHARNYALYQKYYPALYRTEQNA